MIIFDSSTIILLSKIEILELFVENFKGKILIPEKVKFEISREDKQDYSLVSGLIKNKKIGIQKAGDEKQIQKLMKDFNIGEGEAEVLVLALQENAKVVATDDRNAIKACKVLKIDFLTAISILLRAFEKKLIDEERMLIKLQKLKMFGRYSVPIIEDAVKRIKRREEDGNQNTKHKNE
ncbi:MAG: hypothetical protein AB1498_11970 [bacterium]